MHKYLLPEKGKFYKANLHSHSTVSDGHWTPEEMKQRYMEKGYSIIALLLILQNSSRYVPVGLLIESFARHPSVMIYGTPPSVIFIRRVTLVSPTITGIEYCDCILCKSSVNLNFEEFMFCSSYLTTQIIT